MLYGGRFADRGIGKVCRLMRAPAFSAREWEARGERGFRARRAKCQTHLGPNDLLINSVDDVEHNNPESKSHDVTLGSPFFYAHE